jgi:hypothetical protein
MAAWTLTSELKTSLLGPTQLTLARDALSIANYLICIAPNQIAGPKDIESFSELDAFIKTLKGNGRWSDDALSWFDRLDQKMGVLLKVENAIVNGHACLFE